MPFNGEMTVPSGFGGPIVLRVPAGLGLGTSVTLSGVQAAPHYIHGSSDWETELSKPGRWATLQTSDVVLSLPSDSLSQVSDPIALMDFWQSVADTAADLDGTERNRPRAEQYVFDRQISAGWMHSGYPLMAHLESVESALSLESLTTVGDWGFFHELGHNHQHVDWILPGTTETTCNLWSVYLMEQLVSIETAGHPALTPEERSTRMQDYLANGANIDDWSVWVALETYLQLQEAFGWEFYTEIFTRYRALSESQRPDTDAERFDRWAQLSSEISGVNLVPFYQAWGWTLSQSVIDELSSLPAWDANPMAN